MDVNYIHYEVWEEITYPFPNFNGYTVEVWEWISNFILNSAGHVITYPYDNISYAQPWQPLSTIYLMVRCALFCCAYIIRSK